MRLLHAGLRDVALRRLLPKDLKTRAQLDEQLAGNLCRCTGYRPINTAAAEAFAASYLSLLTGGAFGAEYKDIFAFSALILILIFRPKGLLGEVVRERA